MVERSFSQTQILSGKAPAVKMGDQNREGCAAPPLVPIPTPA
jgi:hypothetical protein